MKYEANQVNLQISSRYSRQDHFRFVGAKKVVGSNPTSPFFSGSKYCM